MNLSMVNPYEVLMSKLEHLETLITNTGNVSNESSVTVHPLDVKMGIKEAALYLNITEKSLYKNVKVIPHHKKHGQLYFFESELIEYLKQY